MKKQTRLTIMVLGLWSTGLFGCGSQEEAFFAPLAGKGEQGTATADQSPEAALKQELPGTTFVAEQGPPYNLDGMTAVLVINADGSFVLEGSVLAELCDDGVEKVSGGSFEIVPSGDRQVLVLKQHDAACDELEGFLVKVPAEKKAELQRQFDGLSAEEQEAAQEEFSEAMKINFALMLRYGSLADGELLRMFGEDTVASSSAAE